MMGVTHRATGLCAGALVAWGVREYAVPVASDPVVVALAFACAAAVCVLSGWAAYWPDLDSARSTAARSFGPISGLAHDVVHSMSCAVFDMTATEADREAGNFRGHRGLTHFAVTAVAVGAVLGVGFWQLTLHVPVAGLAVLAGVTLGALAGWLWTDTAGTFVGLATGIAVSTMTQVPAEAVLAGLIGLAVFMVVGKVALPFFRKTWWGLAAVNAGGAVLATTGLLGTEVSNWQGFASALSAPLGLGIGVASALGMLAHDVGDGSTKTGVPLFWPLKIRGQRYYPVFIRRRENRHSTGSDIGDWVEWKIRAWSFVLVGVAVVGWVPGLWPFIWTSVPWPWNV